MAFMRLMLAWIAAGAVLVIRATCRVRIHDDPRGVFVSPDVCEPRAKTYDGIVLELKKSGRFIDPSPPTQGEQDARLELMEDFMASMEACQKAKEAGDEEGFQRALAAAPEDVRASWAAQDDMARRMEAFESGPKTFEVTRQQHATSKRASAMCAAALMCPSRTVMV